MRIKSPASALKNEPPNQGCGSGSWKWKWSFFCGSGSAKILPLPLPHRLFDLESNLAKTFCPFPNVDLSGEVAL